MDPTATGRPTQVEGIQDGIYDVQKGDKITIKKEGDVQIYLVKIHPHQYLQIIRMYLHVLNTQFFICTLDTLF